MNAKKQKLRPNISGYIKAIIYISLFFLITVICIFGSSILILTLWKPYRIKSSLVGMIINDYLFDKKLFSTILIWFSLCITNVITVFYLLIYIYVGKSKKLLTSIIINISALSCFLFIWFKWDLKTEELFGMFGIYYLIRYIGLKISGFKFPPHVSYPDFGYIRPILELAGKKVLDVQNGYTGRPYPVGKIEYNKEDVTKFGNYLEWNLIAKPFVEDTFVRLVFSYGTFSPWPSRKPRFEKVTYVEFDYSGNMSVHIAKKDYEKYKEDLTFYQLCQSLGQLIIQFFELYKQGKEDEILRMLKEGK